MKRWLLPADAAGVDGLVREDDAPLPQPGPGEVRVRVRAVSINFRDQLILAGPFGRLPGRTIVPLSDLAGDVDALGEGVEGFALGDAVTNVHFADWVDGTPPPDGTGLGLGALHEDGVLAEYVVLPAARLTPAPANLDAAEAATLPVAGVTAWNALFDTDGKPFDPNSLLVKQATIRGISVGSHRMHRDLVGFVEAHDLHPNIDRRFAFDDAPAAYRAQVDRDVFGKILIDLS
ncbi:alcohol dehydrogenase catalytic domain-containing protein [Conexibacter woesei]|uniref:Alcohol dehydrogenase GroES domain protein n=1 Tax=Conexibacter woesei (strain DSM 14684 / CCUG 47730 / CIP 108061 / JCM 11494 / NBRC 100937 / ID131577) TaxID=469383 RepID=D3F4D7_CONWI|nr:alcohol dehydrogenase catalytic domain-containing protein [Conexibacter woesei]ADB50509.1 Alcohol dehydrogenase GroES domain protein [Conexibacter woesei DSM 14684]